jgi:hypothetical protein
MPDVKLTAIDGNALPWEERPNEKIVRSLCRKNLIADPDTGMEVRYPAGTVNPPHTQPCAHGMYVLGGTLVTHDGRYGPGHFVWFPGRQVAATMRRLSANAPQRALITMEGGDGVVVKKRLLQNQRRGSRIEFNSPVPYPRSGWFAVGVRLATIV